MRVLGTIRSGEEVRRIQETADSYELGCAAVRAQIPEGWRLLHWKVDYPDIHLEQKA